MARSQFGDLKGPLARALRQVAQAGPGTVLAPVWAEAVGAALASRSEPVRLQDGLLTVTVRPEFLPDLEAARETIVGRLNSRLGSGAVRHVRFVAGKAPP